MTRHVRELFDLTGQTALITGGSRGLGLQVAEALGEAGAHVVLTSRKTEDLAEAVGLLEQRGIKADSISGDASDPAEISRVCAEALRRVGRIDILVNSAGTAWGAPAEDYPLEAWDKVMNLNLRSVFLFSQYCAKHSMISHRHGRIIMMASISGLVGHAIGPDVLAYNTSKAGLINMARQLAGEWGEFGITVNSIAPGWFPTRMSKGVIESRGEEAMASGVPLRRLGDAEDLKGVAVLFASAAGKHITGQVLAVDGGVSAVGG
jgi:NAD(P)-dependent dehydrogenase (short-subunit alcohol dehydrogenase family)